MEQLSCVIIVNNNPIALEKCIYSANAVSDEIINVSDGHTGFPSQYWHRVRLVLEESYNNMEQHLFGLSMVTNELVLLIHSSEYLSIDCQLSLIEIKHSNNFQAFSLPVHYTFEDQKMNLTSWKKRYEIRLFNKSKRRVWFAKASCYW